MDRTRDAIRNTIRNVTYGTVQTIYDFDVIQEVWAKTAWSIWSMGMAQNTVPIIRAEIREQLDG